jgi:hypothetical protein
LLVIVHIMAPLQDNVGKGCVSSDRVRGGSAGKTPRRRSCPRQRHHQRQSKVIRQTSANLLVDEADLVEDLREIVAA